MSAQPISSQRNVRQPNGRSAELPLCSLDNRRHQVAEAMRSLVAMQSMVTVDPALLLRALEIQ